MQGVSEEKEVVRTLSSQVARASVENAQIIKKAENGLKIIALPLIRGGRVLGVIEGIRETSDTRSFTKSESILLSSLALPLACAISNAGRIAEAERLSLTDDLTKLYNGRYLRQYLTSEIRRARRYNSMVSVLFLDLDDFKNINDKYGHLVGSHLLMEVAAVILTSVRDTDVVARYGGDEFVVVLPESDIVQSGRVAERVRDRISKHVFTGGRRLKLSVTASFGVATFPHHCSSPQQLVARADTAMYEAKAARKNCVRLASEAPVEEEVPNVIY
jgi:two-component system, cell cycle response regulator